MWALGFWAFGHLIIDDRLLASDWLSECRLLQTCCQQKINWNSNSVADDASITSETFGLKIGEATERVTNHPVRFLYVKKYVIFSFGGLVLTPVNIVRMQFISDVIEQWCSPAQPSSSKPAFMKTQYNNV